MSVLNDLIDGAVDLTKATGEATSAKIYSVLAAVSLILVLVFLLILFVVEPMSATVLTVVLVLALAYVLTQRSGTIR